MKQREKNAKKPNSPIKAQLAQGVLNSPGRPQGLNADKTRSGFLAALGHNSNLRYLAAHKMIITKTKFPLGKRKTEESAGNLNQLLKKNGSGATGSSRRNIFSRCSATSQLR